MAYLIRKHVDGTVADRWELGEAELVVGRGDKAQARHADAEMSREHFKVAPSAQGHVLRDLQSRNGTFVNGERVTEIELKSNDQIRAGETYFVYSTESAPAAMATLTDVHAPKILKQQ